MRKTCMSFTLLLLFSIITSCVSFVFEESPAPAVFRNLPDIEPHKDFSLTADAADWYKDAVFYHIWINAFHDSNGDGIGDIQGIIQKLDYLHGLGITGIWLSPFFESASQAINLHMYDTTNHYNVDPRFGTNDDIDELLLQAHKRGIRVIFDWVPNHVSSQHPWFTESASSQNGKDNWFVWREEPGSQNGPWGQTVWHRHRRGYYYGVFWNGMPDINFRNQAAKDAITSVAVYWLNRGFDGMRVDAVKYLYENEEATQRSYVDQPENYLYFQAVREQILDAYSEMTTEDGQAYHKFMLAENWTNIQGSLERYMINNGQVGFHMTLDFPLAEAISQRDVTRVSRHWSWVTDRLSDKAWMGSFLSNHDDVAIRPYSIHGESLVRPAIALQLLGPGTPFIYYGNEIGMTDAREFAGASHADRRHRQPFLWEDASMQKQEGTSLLQFHKDLIHLRHERSSLRRGSYTEIFRSARTLAFLRTYEGEATLVLVNLRDNEEMLDFDLSGFPQKLLYQYGNSSIYFNDQQLEGRLGPAAVLVWEISNE